MEAYDWIFDLTVDISTRASENGIDRTARRVSDRKMDGVNLDGCHP